MGSRKVLGFAALFLLVSGALAFWATSSTEEERSPASSESAAPAAVSEPTVKAELAQETVSKPVAEVSTEPETPIHQRSLPVEKAPKETSVAASSPPQILPEKEISSQEAAFQPAPLVPAKAAVVSMDPVVGLRIFLGLGMNYVQYDEQLSDLTTKYRDLSGPSVHSGVSMDLTPETAVELSYKSTPMKFDNSSVSMSALTGNWQTLVLQALSSITERPAGQGSGWQMLWGVQMHQMPMALFETGTNAPVMRNIELLNASLGLAHEKYLDPNTRSEIYLRAQYPISSQATDSGANLSVQPVLLFDGSVGAEKKIRPGYWVGIHWYGQYQRMKFKYQDPKVDATGTHTVLFSNAELRLTIEF